MLGLGWKNAAALPISEKVCYVKTLESSWSDDGTPTLVQDVASIVPGLTAKWTAIIKSTGTSYAQMPVHHRRSRTWGQGHHKLPPVALKLPGFPGPQFPTIVALAREVDLCPTVLVVFWNEALVIFASIECHT